MVWWEFGRKKNTVTRSRNSKWNGCSMHRHARWSSWKVQVNSSALSKWIMANFLCRKCMTRTSIFSLNGIDKRKSPNHEKTKAFYGHFQFHLFGSTSTFHSFTENRSGTCPFHMARPRQTSVWKLGRPCFPRGKFVWASFTFFNPRFMNEIHGLNAKFT